MTNCAKLARTFGIPTWVAWREKRNPREKRNGPEESGGEDAGRGRLELGGAVKRGAHRFARDAQAERV